MQFIKRLYLVVILTFSLFSCGGNDEPFSKGEHYLELSVVSKSHEPQVVLFFSAACPHCFKFDKALEPWVKSKPDNVTIERIPVNFGRAEWEPLQKAYATLRTLGVQDELSLELFSAVQEKRFWLGDDTSVANWLHMHGLKKPDVLKAYNSEQAKQLLSAYYASEHKFTVRSIPRLIVNGIYEIKTNSIEGDTEEQRQEMLAELINFLLTK